MTLDEYLIAHNISSAEAGRQLGLAESTIWRIRNGEVIPMANTWVAIIDWSAGEIDELVPRRDALPASRSNGKLETDLETDMKPKMPPHCKGCTAFHNAGRFDPKGGLEKYNAWCCRKGQPANKSIGWCKQHNMKAAN